LGWEENKVESSGSHRSGLLTAGGIFAIVSGASQVTTGAITVGSTIANIELLKALPSSAFLGVNWTIGTGVGIFALGIVAIIGGISATRRRMFLLSLAGAICCQVSSVIYVAMSYIGVWLGGGVIWVPLWLVLGLLAIIFICLSQKEFEVEGSSGTRGL
jgi:hypothetical protein